ncbi:hypothetical protein [Paracoccus indicus]|uniref:hypothetical protein n=1 Tax=Paracoccus indicus TaxID=2079229 RepID=UPI0013B41C35|nr:hypothetical protein [Paracoccus indicus]
MIAIDAYHLNKDFLIPQLCQMAILFKRSVFFRVVDDKVDISIECQRGALGDGNYAFAKRGQIGADIGFRDCRVDLH